MSKNCTDDMRAKNRGGKIEKGNGIRGSPARLPRLIIAITEAWGERRSVVSQRDLECPATSAANFG